jgi:hypothetical protein
MATQMERAEDGHSPYGKEVHRGAADRMHGDAYRLAENSRPDERPLVVPKGSDASHLKLDAGDVVNRRPNGDRYTSANGEMTVKLSNGQVYMVDSKDQDIFYARNRGGGLDRSYNNGASVHYDRDPSSGYITYGGRTVRFANDRITSVSTNATGQGDQIPPYNGK